MLVAVGLQVVSSLVLALLAWFVFGASSAISLLLGAAAAFIPNALFALRLAMHRGKSPESYPVVFFLGEFAKIALTIALLVAVVQGYNDLHWPSLLTGLIVSLKVPLFALWLTGNRAPIAELMKVKGEDSSTYAANRALEQK
jgi:ATP synthase protein I